MGHLPYNVLMHIRRHSGFTLVELMVVITIIAILSAIAIVSYDIVLKQTHDSKRQSDITAMQHTLETYYQANGVYPSGCIQPNYSASVGCTVFTDVNSASSKTGNGTMYSDPTPADQINASTTLTRLRQILPGIDESFGDPVNTSTNPISNMDSGDFKYLYIGGLENTTASNENNIVSVNYNSGNATFTCAMWFNLTPGQISSYVVGYYGEQDHIWHLFDGQHGVKIGYGPGSGGANAPFCWGGAANAIFDNRAP